jgi:transposase
MAHYVGLDVSDKDIAIHVIDDTGRLVWRGKRASEPGVIATALRRHAPELTRVGLETGQLAPWLYMMPSSTARRSTSRGRPSRDGGGR